MSIFDHISIKAGDSATVNAFYKAALSPLAIKQKFLLEHAKGVTGGYGREQVNFFVGQATSAAQAAMRAYSPLNCEALP